VEVKVRKNDVPGDEEIHMLQRQLDTHIGKFEQHVAQADHRWERILASQEENTTSIQQLTVCTSELHASTKDVVEAWNTSTSVVRFGAMIGRFAKWVAGFAVLSGLIAWAGEHFKL